MNCETCGHKMIIISCEYGVLIYCPECFPEGDKIFTSMVRKK